MQNKVDKSSKGNFVKVPNQWFPRSSGRSLFHFYGEKGLILFIRMLQQVSKRETYELSDYHISKWFSYTDNRSLRSIFTILQQFKEDKLFSFEVEGYMDYKFNDIYKGLIYFQPTSLILPKDNFFILYDYEINTILVDYDGKADKSKLLSLFSCLKSYYSAKNRICVHNPSIETMAEQTLLSKNTVQLYLDILVDIGLILYDNPGTKLFLDNIVRECNHMYTMNYAGNIKVLEEVINGKRKELIQLEKDDKLKLVNNEIGRQKKSISMKLYWLPDKLARGVISQEEYDRLYAELTSEYEELLKKQKRHRIT